MSCPEIGVEIKDNMVEFAGRPTTIVFVGTGILLAPKWQLPIPTSQILPKDSIPTAELVNLIPKGFRNIRHILKIPERFDLTTRGKELI